MPDGILILGERDCYRFVLVRVKTNIRQIRWLP